MNLNDVIPEADLPVATPGPDDYLRGTRRSDGKSMLFLLPEISAAATAIGDALDAVVADAQSDAEIVIQGLGYVPPVPYSTGIDVHSTLQTVEYAGTIYAPLSQALPFTTGSSFDATKWRVVTGVTRVELADGNTPGRGAALVAFKASAPGAVLRDALAKLRERVSLKDFGAVGDGVTDDTAVVQAAVDYCAANCRDLLVPAGKYKLTAVIYVTGVLKMYGEGFSVARGAQAPGPGSWFYLAHAGKGFFISTINSGGLFKDFGTYRDHAVPGAGWTPTVADYDFEMNTASNEWTFADMMLLNPYKGFSLSNRPTLRNIKMQPFREGVFIDNCRDVARLLDVHVWPFWSENTNVQSNMLGNLQAFKLKRVDNPQIRNCFSIWHKVGIYIDGDNAGATTYRALISDCNIESGAVALQLAPGADNCTIKIANSVLHGADEVALSFGILVECDNSRMHLDCVEIANYGAYAMTLNGASNVVNMCNCDVNNWNKSNTSIAAVSIGSTNRVNQVNTTFTGGNGALTWSGTGKMKGIISSNLESASTDGAGDITITHGLRCKPTGVFIIPTEPDTAYTYRYHSTNTTTFKARVRNDTGAVVTGTGVIVFWEARDLN